MLRAARDRARSEDREVPTENPDTRETLERLH